MINIGDYITRNSYNNDTVFEVINRNKDTAANVEIQKFIKRTFLKISKFLLLFLSTNKLPILGVRAVIILLNRLFTAFIIR